jgi:hypothetical protein
LRWVARRHRFCTVPALLSTLPLIQINAPRAARDYADVGSQQIESNGSTGPPFDRRETAR